MTKDSQYIQGTTLLMITENTLEDGSVTYDIDIDLYDIHIPTVALNSSEALQMGGDIAKVLHKVTGSKFHVTWNFS